MALKGDRNVLETDISFFLNETAEKGQVVSFSTAGSGAAMDNSSALATVAAEASGATPLGVVLNDVVNIDQTRQHINWHKDEVQQGGKITILTKGTIVTDQISGTSPTVGQTAYVADAGKISADQDGTATAIGRFLSTKDANDFCKIAINLP
jgi:hypothetical protein